MIQPLLLLHTQPRGLSLPTHLLILAQPIQYRRSTLINYISWRYGEWVVTHIQDICCYIKDISNMRNPSTHNKGNNRIDTELVQ